MNILNLLEYNEFIAGDNCHLREILSPLKTPELAIQYSLAHAGVQAGETTFKHALRTSEIY